MDNFETPTAKLFYLINELYRNRIVNQAEKIQLKEYVFDNNHAVFTLIERESDQNKIIESIIEILRGPQSPRFRRLKRKSII
ncbi:hypothetical protein pb186bvf_005396 [Paramecium bursaria]